MQINILFTAKDIREEEKEKQNVNISSIKIKADRIVESGETKKTQLFLLNTRLIKIQKVE